MIYGEPFELFFDENDNLLTSSIFVLSGRIPKIEYKEKGTTEYTTTNPSLPGEYYVRITIASDDEWNDLIYESRITIKRLVLLMVKQLY